MRFPRWLAAGFFALSLGPPVAAERLLQSHALVPCSNDGIVSVNHFDVVFTPGNLSALVSFDGQATYGGKIRIDLELYVYGYKATTKSFDPCVLKVDALCPLTENTSLKITNVPLDLKGVDLSIIPGESAFRCCRSYQIAPPHAREFWNARIPPDRPHLALLTGENLTHRYFIQCPRSRCIGSP